MFSSGHKRSRADAIEKYNRDNGVKQIMTNDGNMKNIYRCKNCNFVACTEGNIESHVRSKHSIKDENINPK